jgi:magnesium transporter
MSSLPGDGPVFSSSPTSISGVSPARHRESTSQSDAPGSRPRVSPTVVRSYDLNDPEMRERQRTMDVDMAMHLSRARRETVSMSPGVSPYEPPPAHTQTESIFTPLSMREQHDIDIARGEPHPADHDGVDGDEEITNPVDLRLPHISQAHDPSLVVRSPDHPTDHGDPSASLSGLPTYQPHVSSDFNFGIMEVFALQEKASLGLSSPSETFTGIRRRDANAAPSAPSVTLVGPSDIPTAHSLSPRHRKISQSHSQPRHHRKIIGGKMALFESNVGEPTLPGRLMGTGGPGASSAINMAAGGSETRQGAPTDGGGIGGIISTGHDRPYRFSFYSNALSATIHARSLSELPGDGQSFEDLFNGLSVSSEHSTTGNTNNPPTVVSTPTPVRPDSNKRLGQDWPNGQGNNNNTSYFSRDSKNAAGDNAKNGNAQVGSGGFEGNTWWLDVQSPTDEEMKLLSKVGHSDYMCDRGAWLIFRFC